MHQFLQATPETTSNNIEQATGLREVTARIALEQLEAARLIMREPNEDYGIMRFRVAPLNPAVLQQIAANIATRQDHKRRLLAKMVTYAETNACRRRVILDYFGDPGPPTRPFAVTMTLRAPRHNLRPCALQIRLLNRPR